MIVPNRVTACHHIELERGCAWCLVYAQHSIKQCDRCKIAAHTDAIYLSTTGQQPQLICVGCHLWEMNEGRV